MKQDEVKNIVKEKYGAVASCNGCCCKSRKISANIGYSEADLKKVGTANLGLGCGNPLSFGIIKEGDTVLDLGSGAGIDAILAAEKTGASGKVIGVDMTPEMIERATENARNLNIKNVEFRLGEIEKLPIEDDSIDLITTNCVINLSPDKTKVFKEAYRVLKFTGKMYVSDIVLLGELTPEQKNDKELLAGCVAGALLKKDYLNAVKEAGFKWRILRENKEISKEQYGGIALESLTFELSK